MIETGGYTCDVAETGVNAWDLLGRFEFSDDQAGPQLARRGWAQHHAKQAETGMRGIVAFSAHEEVGEVGQVGQVGQVEEAGTAEAGDGDGKVVAGAATQMPITVATIRAFSAALADAGVLEATDPKLVDLMRVLEELKSAAAAVQARAAAVFDASQRRAQARAGVPAAQLGRGVGAQVALARRDSPHRGSRHLGFGKALVHEMPHTLAALSSGILSEWRATLLVRETACLDVEDRHRVDELICADPSSLEGVGDRKLIARIRSITQSIDPASQVRRNAQAVSDRHVSCRPAPDTMCYLTGLLPVAQGVAVYAALSRAADSLRATGDERGRGQIMADTLVERVTGQERADRVPVEVQLVITDRTLLTGVLIPNDAAQDGKQLRSRDLGQVREEDQVRDREGSLSAAPVAPAVSAAPAGQPDTPAYFPGYGIVPGAWARELIRSALGTDDGEAPTSASDLQAWPPGAGRPASAGHHAGPPGVGSSEPPPGARSSSEPPPDTSRFPEPDPASHATTAKPGQAEQLSLVSLRRLFMDPVSGELTAMESKARTFPAGLARLIRTRDQTCRTPWCDAPIRHIDHIQPHADGGPTSYTNGQGLCEACNQAKEAPGWNATAMEPVPLSQSVSGRRAEATAAAAAVAPAVAPDATESTEPRERESAQTAAEHGPCPRNAPDRRHSVRITTPTGHAYTSTAPPLPGTMIQFG